jgi:hypothetical protein
MFTRRMLRSGLHQIIELFLYPALLLFSVCIHGVLSRKGRLYRSESIVRQTRRQLFAWRITRRVLPIVIWSKLEARRTRNVRVQGIFIMLLFFATVCFALALSDLWPITLPIAILLSLSLGSLSTEIRPAEAWLFLAHNIGPRAVEQFSALLADHNDRHKQSASLSLPITLFLDCCKLLVSASLDALDFAFRRRSKPSSD